MIISMHIIHFTYSIYIMMIWRGIIWICIVVCIVVAYFSKGAKKQHKNTIIVNRLCDWDKKTNIKDMIKLWSFWLCISVTLLLSWCSSIESQVNNQIQQSENTITEKKQIIEQAQQEKAKQEKIRDAWIAYLQALKWWDDTNTTWVHSVAEIKQNTTTVSTIWYGKCVDAEWVENIWNHTYEDYIKNDNCNEFAGTSICYENKKEKCIIFENEEKYNDWLQS